LKHISCGITGGRENATHKKHKPKYNPSPKKQTLAQKLTNAGWVLYTKSSCPWCAKQVDKFGTDGCHLNIINCLDCDMEGPALEGCQMTWVYPSWVNRTGPNVRIEAGTRSLEELQKLLKSH